MWSKNVLRLRRNFSTTTSRWLGAQPLSHAEFLEALVKVFPQEQWRRQPRIGLAISGGVDSMALATLYARAAQELEYLPECHAMIVDHKVRPGSTQEARWVVKQLRQKLQMKASILYLKWPDNVDPHNIDRFETEARMLRFQALGTFCRHQEIEQMLLAHHQDDQAETVLMRLMKSRLRAGLVGMRGVEDIPECHGMHLIHHSGRANKTISDIPFPIEDGGMTILRPLLGFDKNRLIATCEEHGVEWAEDKTNAIPTVTSRNAIRHMLRNNRLPEALSSKSLISLSETMQRRVEGHMAMAERVFNQTPIALNIQVASLIVRFPPSSAFLDRPIESDKDKNDARNTACLYLQKVSEFVTPKEFPSVGQMSRVVDSVWPELAVEELDMSDMSTESFSSHGVWFRRWEHQSPFTPRRDDSLDSDNPFAEHDSLDRENPAMEHNYANNNNMEWQLSRQPSDSVERKTVLVIPPKSKERWHLFDNRFWIKLKNKYSYDDLVLRNLDKKRYDDIVAGATKPRFQADRITAWKSRFVRAALSLTRPADPLRLSLPALYRRDTTGKETFLALPTLNVGIVNVDFAVKLFPKWEVRYKKCDFGTRRLEEIVVPGVSTWDISDEALRMERELAFRSSMKATALRKAARAAMESDAKAEMEANAQRDPDADVKSDAGDQEDHKVQSSTENSRA